MRRWASPVAGVFFLVFSALGAEKTSPAAGATPQPPYNWRGIQGSGVFPAGGLVTEFWDLAADMRVEVKDQNGRVRTVDLPGKPGSRKNIVWRTTLPHWGQNAPVVVRDRVFVLCDEGWKHDAPVLVCLGAGDGKVLWQQLVDHLDAWPADRAAAGRKARAKTLEYWRTFMRAWNALYWDNERNGWQKPPEYRGRMLGPGQPEKWVGRSRQDLLDQAKAAGFAMPDEWRIGVSGGWRSRYYWRFSTPGIRDAYDTCNRNRYHWHPGWTSEGPYFGSTMGSVVSDGERVYAVTALDAAACFDLDGRRAWVADLDGRHVMNYPASAPGMIQNHMASPVLADDKLVYYHRDAACMYGLDKATGETAWKTESPRAPDDFRDWKYLGGRKPIGYQGHMGPGGTPVVMRLGQAAVVVSGHGLVVRVADGKLLGQVKLPKGTRVAKGKVLAEADQDCYGASYNSWVAHGEVLFYQPHAGLYAVRLGLQGERLTQELLWRLDAHVDSRNPNLVYREGRLYAKAAQGRRRGIAAIDPASGRILAWGRSSGGHDTSLAFGSEVAVWPTGYTGDKTEWKRSPAATPAHGMTTYAVVSLPELKQVGSGYLCPEAPAGDVRERHIAGIGTARAVWGNAGTTCWGNRVFIRNNDYLWCIGDPGTPYIPPERVLRTPETGRREDP